MIRRTRTRPTTAATCIIFQILRPVRSAQSRVPRPMRTTQNSSDARTPPRDAESMAPARPPMMSMMEAQQMSWTMLSTAARFEPITPTSAIKVLPMTWPRRIARSAARNPIGARSPPAQISASEMATPAQRRKKSVPPRLRSPSATGRIFIVRVMKSRKVSTLKAFRDDSFDPGRDQDCGPCMTGEVEADGAGTLAREMGLLGLEATGVCSMVGAGINVIPVMVQRNVPGIGPNVTVAFALAMVPAVLAALSYAAMASAMPRAGGSYVYASRSLPPYLGLVASFSQWLEIGRASC